MSSASDDRGNVTIDCWGSGWDAEALVSSHDTAWTDPVEPNAPEAHWGGIEAGEAWSEEIWDATPWGSAALNVDDGRRTILDGPLWPAAADRSSRKRICCNPKARSALYKVFQRQDLVFTPATQSVAAPMSPVSLGEHAGAGAPWPRSRRASTASYAPRFGSVEPVTEHSEPRWPVKARPAIIGGDRLQSSVRAFGLACRLLPDANDASQLSLPYPLAAVHAPDAIGLADALSAPVLREAARVFGPCPPEAVRKTKLREALKRRPRVGAGNGAGMLAIGALFDALATEREAMETRDRIDALERSALETATGAKVEQNGLCLLDDVSFGDASVGLRQGAPSDGLILDDSDDLEEDAFGKDLVAAEDGDLDAFSRPRLGPPAGSLTEGLLRQLKRDLRQQSRPRRRAASPAPSGRRAS